MEEYQSREIAALLLKWYNQNRRNLPWRINKNPYHIWISEIMLQQTRVETVIEYYLRFIKELPNVMTLANVPDERLLKLWEGLGYYSRARNLKKAAIQIVRNYKGEIPASYKDLLALPGIGPYTAGAIASIAFDVRIPAIDGNVLRVMSRILAIDGDSRKARDIYDYLSAVIPENRPGDFNQALMELGAVVCLPNARPQCGKCPAASLCQAFIRGETEKYPVKVPKKSREIEEKSVFIIESDGKYLIHQRPSTGLLAGMWEFPHVPGILTEKSLPEALLKYNIRVQALVCQIFSKHIFTHKEWHMKGFFVKADSISYCGNDYKWVPLHEMEQNTAIPSAFGAFMEIIRENR